MSAKHVPAFEHAWPVLGHAIPFARDPIAFLDKAHEECGPVFELRLPVGRRAVVLIGPSHNRFFFEETDKRLSIMEAYAYFKRMFSDDFFYFGGAEAYQRQRNIILPCFKSTRLPDYVEVIADETERFMARLGDEGEFNLVDEFGPLVMHVAAHAFLGREFRETLGREVFEEMRHFSEGMDPITPAWMPLPKFARSRKARESLHARFRPLIAERRAHAVSPPDFLQTMADAVDENGNLHEEGILIDLILLLVWAGHETTAGHVSWTLIDLLQNPAAMEKLLAQQQEVLGERGTVVREDVRQLTYMDLVLQETERLHPVAWMLMRHATEDIEHDGYLIEAGTDVFISPWLSHRLPDVFEQPERYMPERFDGRRQVAHSLIGFGGGRHRCTGVNFAKLEMKVIITMLLARYDFTLLTPDPQPASGPVTKWPESTTRVAYRRRGTLAD
ncbi:MAG: cytochrome P450 [Gammaproteobacteria bacterium]|nr:MAG: cytochrome P450 [Gammaproteobacteria bacterium]